MTLGLMLHHRAIRGSETTHTVYWLQWENMQFVLQKQVQNLLILNL